MLENFDEGLNSSEVLDVPYGWVTMKMECSIHYGTQFDKDFLNLVQVLNARDGILLEPFFETILLEL